MTIPAVSAREPWLLGPDTKVTCPGCEHEFSLEQGFARKALEGLEEASAEALAAMLEAERGSVEKRIQQLAAERERAAQRETAELRKLLEEQALMHANALAEVQALAARSFAPQREALHKALAERDLKLNAVAERESALEAREQALEARVTAAAASKANELVAMARRSFEQQLAEKALQVAELRTQELVLRKEKSAVEDRAAALEIEVARKLDAGRAEIELRARASERERSDLEKAELQKKLDDAGTKLTEAQRKIAQGSQQMQGEVLELVIEDGLRRLFTLDRIEEVKKGQRGGDVQQRVFTRVGQPAGMILWETKRARDWSGQWTAKLKEDMRASGAEIGVLVTLPTAMPKEFESAQPFGLHEDVWVSSWSSALCLAEVLRSGLLDVYKQKVISAGKGEKMEALYDYLTSAQFAQKLKAVYGAFRIMQEDLQKERALTEQRWARRDKQITTGMKELLGFAGDVQGLSQQELPQLELEEPPGE